MSDTRDEFDDDLDFGDDETGTEAEQVNDGDIQGTEEVVAEDVTVTEEQSEEDKQAAAKAEAEANAAKAEAELNEKLDAFKETVQSAVASDDWDTTTGSLPEVLLVKITTAYAELPGAKGKAAGKRFLQDSMQEYMVKGADDALNFVRARTYMDLNNTVSATKAPRGESGVAKAKVDPTEAFAQRIAAMMLAPSLVAVPEDVEATWADKAQALAEGAEADVEAYQKWAANTAEDKGDAPQVSEVVLAAVKIAAGRAAGVRKSGGSTGSTRVSTATGHSGDIAVHLTEAFADKNVGDFMTIAEIAKAVTSQYGGDKPAPSQGAIAARLFPQGDASKCKLDFVKPEGKEDGRPVKGAVKVK